jgi:hypothetical protein
METRKEGKMKLSRNKGKMERSEDRKIEKKGKREQRNDESTNGEKNGKMILASC